MLLQLGVHFEGAAFWGTVISKAFPYQIAKWSGYLFNPFYKSKDR